MESGAESPRPRRSNTRLLGAVLIGIGVLALLAQSALFAPPRVSVPPYVGPMHVERAAAHEVVVLTPTVLAMPEMPAKPPLAQPSAVQRLPLAEQQMELAAGQAERQMEAARPRTFWLAPMAGVLGLLAGLLRLGLTVATFGLLAIGAFLLVRELSRNRQQPAESAPLTGPEADRARE